MRIFIHSIECDYPGCRNKLQLPMEPDGPEGYWVDSITSQVDAHKAVAAAGHWKMLPDFKALCPEHAAQVEVAS